MEVSICIPTYNSAQYLRDAIKSALRQRLDDFEIVVVDNASTDDTESVVRSFSNARIRYFKNASNLGSRENFNRSLEKAMGKYVKFLCADDVLRDGIVVKQRDILRNRHDVTLVSSDMLVTDSQLGVKELVRFFPGFRDGRRLALASLSALVNFVGGPSNVMFRREDASGIAFDSTYRWVSDLKFEAQLLIKGAYANINEPGILYRRHPSADSVTSCPEEIRIEEHIRLAKEFGYWNPISLALAFRNRPFTDKKQPLTDCSSAFRPRQVRAAASVIRYILVARRHLRPIERVPANQEEG